MNDGARQETARRAALRSAVAASRHRLTGHRAPLSVTLVVTRRCPLVCACCATPVRGAGQEMETWELLALIDELARCGTARIGITGGEPMARADLGVLLERCRAHGIWTTLETSGVGVPERLDELAPVGQLLVALDGREDVHDGLREPGAWATATAAITAAHARGIPTQTVTVLTRETLGELDWLVAHAERLGITAVFQALQVGVPQASRSAPRRMPDDDALRAAFTWLLAARQAGRPVATSEKVLRYLERWPSYAQATSPAPHEDVLCMAGQLYCAVDADGTVYRCFPRVGEEPVGNVRDDGFVAVFTRMRDTPCRACTSTACTEYNYLYNLHGPRLVELARSIATGPRGAP